MRKLFLAYLFFLNAGFCWGAGKLPPGEILKRTDAVRNPQADYAVDVRVVSYALGKKSQDSVYKVMAKGRENAVVQTLSPAIDRGRILLMAGNNFWGFLPKVSKPLRISLQERLVGEVANGDLARANFSGDYTPSLQAVKSAGSKKFYILELKAKTNDVTYGKVVLWVNKANFYPHFAEFYAFSGRKLKTCQYEQFAKLGNGIRPTRLTMRDAVNEKNYSILDYSNMVVSPLPEKYFTKEYMKRLAE